MLYSKEQYLAIGGLICERRHVLGRRDSQPISSSIQIWKCNRESHQMKLSLLICHEFGSLFDLKFNSNFLPGDDIIGCMACTFSDGSVRVMNLPNPNKIKSLNQFSEPITIRWSKSLFESFIPNALFYKVLKNF